MNTTKERLRQISQLCWKVVNELREANKMLIDDMPEEFSKVYEIADEIEDWLIMNKEERRMKCYKCDEGELRITPLSPPDEGCVVGCNKCDYLDWFPTIEDVYNDILFGNKRGEKNVSK